MSESKDKWLCEGQVDCRGNAATMHPRCGMCKGQGRHISRKTVLLMLKPHLLEQAVTRTFGFCSRQSCPVVYFEDSGALAFMKDDLRVTVGVKAHTEPIPLCYCFGFDVRHVRMEISETGFTTIPDRILRFVREGLCACETCNPSGTCCLGDVNRVVKRLLTE